MDKKKEQEILEHTPQLQNINSDPSMTGMIKKALIEGDNIIGRETNDFTPNLVISGAGIANKHCLIKYNEGPRSAVIFPNDEDHEKYQVKVNGRLLLKAS